MADTPRPDDRRLRGQEARRVGDPVTQSQFYEAIDGLKEYILDRHRSMRDNMDVNFQKVREAMDAHAKEDLIVERRVATMEIRNEDRDKEASRRTVYLSAIFGSTAAFMWDVLKKAITGHY
jgi:hypothetical protein